MLTLVAILLTSSNILQAQRYCITPIETDIKSSFRGLSVVSDKIIWVSGSAGTIGKSIDGGIHWEWIKVKGFELRDFRDIEAFDENTALIMGIAEPAIILKTNDGGHTWQTIFKDSTKGMFLDAMSFADSKNGVVLGDPINGSHFMATTKNGGNTWVVSNNNFSNQALEEEAFFASSGTNIHIGKAKSGKLNYVYVTGGKHSRINMNQLFYELPIIQGKASTGANSIALNNSQNGGVIVGGDFANDTILWKNSVSFTVDKKRQIHFNVPETPPNGYKSCVIYFNKKSLITCGTTGTDISLDNGKNWQNIDKVSYHVVQQAKKGNAVFLAGSKGRIGRLDLIQ